MTAFVKKEDVANEFKQVFETANKYHFLHSIALLGVPLCRRPQLVLNYVNNFFIDKEARFHKFGMLEVLL